MGVVNISPESFFSGSYVPEANIRKKAEEMIAQGADLIDIGARSTAPGSAPISVQEEKERITRALNSLDGSGITISVDTMHPEVLEEAIKHDIHAVNDISGLINQEMARGISESGLPAVLMAATRAPGDSCTFSETLTALRIVTERADSADIPSYILDPAIGRWIMERTPEADFELCRRFSQLTMFSRPLLAAVSRKSFIGSATGRAPDDRLAGTLGVTTWLIQAGAAMIRCHDVSETRDLIQVISSLQGA